MFAHLWFQPHPPFHQTPVDFLKYKALWVYVILTTMCSKQLRENPKKLITTPIFYPNDKPHIGHTYTCFIADFLTRHYRQQGFNVWFSTGLDEHGQKIAKTAAKLNITPQKHVDNMASVFKQMMKAYHIDFSHFIRTTDSQHKKAVAQFWNTLKQNNLIYLGKYEGWYDVSDENFVKDEEIDNSTIKNKQAITIHNKPVIWLEEDCYFFKLSKFTTHLTQHYQAHKQAIQPKQYLNEVLGFLEQGLNDIAISRNTVTWGIPVPTRPQNLISKIMHAFTKNSNKSQTIYVWIDALVNYLTTIQYPAYDQEYWNNSTHIIGKDILKFHAIYWPAFLQAAKITPPRQILTHGWWLMNEEKMSKSLMNMVDPVTLLEKYDPEEIRWFFIREMTFGQDASFSFERLEIRCQELSNIIGNLIQRSTSLLIKKHNGKVLAATETLDENATSEAHKAIETHKFQQYSQIIVNIATECNKYLDLHKPWSADDSHQVLSNVIHAIRTMLSLLNPIMPNKTATAFEALQKNQITSLPILFPRR